MTKKVLCCILNQSANSCLSDDAYHFCEAYSVDPLSPFKHFLYPLKKDKTGYFLTTNLHKKRPLTDLLGSYLWSHKSMLRSRLNLIMFIEWKNNKKRLTKYLMWHNVGGCNQTVPHPPGTFSLMCKWDIINFWKWFTSPHSAGWCCIPPINDTVYSFHAVNFSSLRCAVQCQDCT